MAKKEFFSRQKDAIQKHRSTILYLAVALGLMGTMIGWGLLPDQVAVVADPEAAVYRPKNAFLLAHLGMLALFSVLFWKRPRELPYLVGLTLSLILVYNLLFLNL